jgi:hypothetical protein
VINGPLGVPVVPDDSASRRGWFSPSGNSHCGSIWSVCRRQSSFTAMSDQRPVTERKVSSGSENTARAPKKSAILVFSLSVQRQSMGRTAAPDRAIA